jgi:glycerophosphoryl diester phosphodiesterase
MLLPRVSLTQRRARVAAPNRADFELAVRHAPVLRFDVREPFLPSAVGFTVLRQDGPSPSFPRDLHLAAGDRPPAATIIEYAVWWDWDIGHLYELEHVWVYLDTAGRVVWGEASQHGGFQPMLRNGGPPLTGERLTVCSEPGKHAFAASPERLILRADDIKFNCGPAAGWAGVHVTPLFEGIITQRTPLAKRLVLSYLRRQAFEPSFDFSQMFEITPELLALWPTLNAWIPGRVAELVAELEQAIPPGERHIYRIAHRGASAYAPENTLRAIELAAALGADMVELDIRRSADGVPVILHDEDLSRTTTGRGRVQDWNLADLKTLEAGPGETIPTLDEALRACRRHGMRPYLELKTGEGLPTVMIVVRRYYSPSEVMLASFRPDWLAEVKALAPEATTSILFRSPEEDAVALAQSIQADYIHPCWEGQGPEPRKLLTREWLERVRAARLGVICWHEERPAEIAALRQLDVDGICSNTPERLRPGYRTEDIRP